MKLLLTVLSAQGHNVPCPYDSGDEAAVTRPVGCADTWLQRPVSLEGARPWLAGTPILKNTPPGEIRHLHPMMCRHFRHGVGHCDNQFIVESERQESAITIGQFVVAIHVAKGFLAISY